MTLIIKIVTIFLNIIYFLMKLLPVQNKITMISRQSNQETMDFRLLKKEINKRDSKIKIVVLCHELEGGAKSTVRIRLKYVLHMFRQMYHIATSRVVILDSYCIVVSILKHKKSLRIVQMWHSMGTMKKFGYAILGLEEGSNPKLACAMQMHKNYDYIFASSEAYKSHLASGFNYTTDNILTYPLPRYDLLKDSDFHKRCKARIEATYPSLKKKKNIIYCPTFRKDESDFNKAVNKLIDCTDTKKYNLIIKLHPLSKVKLNSLKKGIIVDYTYPTFDMLAVADYVISDYSCVIYEAAIKNIAIYFYNFDMDLYLTNRGLAIDYNKELPGVIAKDPKIIMNSIENDDYDYVTLKKFADKYVRPTKHATSDIVDFIFEIMI